MITIYEIRNNLPVRIVNNTNLTEEQLEKLPELIELTNERFIFLTK